MNISKTYLIIIAAVLGIAVGGNVYTWLVQEKAFIEGQVAKDRAEELVKENERIRKQNDQVELELHAETLRREAESKLFRDEIRSLSQSIRTQAPEELIRTFVGLLGERRGPAPVISADRTKVTISVEEYRDTVAQIAEMKGMIARIPVLEASIKELQAGVSFQNDEIRRLGDIIKEKDVAIDKFKTAAKTSGFKKRAVQIGAIAIGIAIGRVL